MQEDESYVANVDADDDVRGRGPNWRPCARALCSRVPVPRPLKRRPRAEHPPPASGHTPVPWTALIPRSPRPYAMQGIGHKWSLAAVYRELEARGVGISALRGRIDRLLVKTLIAAQPHVNDKYGEHFRRRGACFELFGFDVLLDADLKPWLLEVNVSPSLVSSSPLDKRLKGILAVDSAPPHFPPMLGAHAAEPPLPRPQSRACLLTKQRKASPPAGACLLTKQRKASPPAARDCSPRACREPT